MELSGHPREDLSRRAFLAGGAAVVAATWLLGPGAWRARPNPLLQLLADGARTASVGFADAASELADAVGARIVPAGRLTVGDTSLVGEAVHVRVPGLTPATGGGVRRLSLDVLVPSPDRRATEPLPFHAWSTDGDPAHRMSSPVGFTAAVGDQPSLGFAVDLAAASSAQAHERQVERSLAIFTSGREPGLPKLREGLYLIGVDAGVWDEPRRLPAADDPAWADLRSLIVSVRRAAAPAAAAP